MLQQRVIRDLCRFPMWIIDNVEILDDDSIAIVGWALTDDGDLSSGIVSMDGKLPDEFRRLHNPEFARIFPWHVNADWAPYRAIFRRVGVASQELLKFSYISRWTRSTFNRWQNIWIPLRALRDQTVIIPDGPRMHRTQGNSSTFWYVTYGATVAQMLNEITTTYFGRGLTSFPEICDWGAGCGRVVQGIQRITQQSNITGIDIDHDNIEWCQRSISSAVFASIPLLPPTDFPDARFDLLYGISVFTHLARDTLEAWRDEIYRIVKPGGVLLATINGGASMVSVGDEALITRVLASGFDDTRIDDSLGDKVKERSYYRGTFMSEAQAKEIFGAKFQVRDMVMQANASGQDLIVCERM